MTIRRDFCKGYAVEHRALQRALVGLPARERSLAAVVLLNRLLAAHVLRQAGCLACDLFQADSLRCLLAGQHVQTAWLADLLVPEALDFESAKVPDAALIRASTFLAGFAGSPASAIDLLGPLFEARIHEKNLGAYYTSADVTRYIVERTVLPWLLDQLRTRGVAPFWGEEEANDLVTANRDLRRLLLDAIMASADLGQQVLDILRGMTILDPTCGAGAFLLAAWRLLDEVAVAAGNGPLDWSPNLFGIDLVPQTVELCRLLLLLQQTAAWQSGQPLAPGKPAIALGNALDPLDQPGFDVVIGNPPYLAAHQAGYRPTGLATAACPDVYAWIMERSSELLRPGGRCGLIVPLSLGFSERFASCRRLLFERYASNWFASFGRIPDALFRFDVRVRNVIHLGVKGAGPPRCHATRLHRWFERERPQLFEQLSYAPFDPSLWQGRMPKPNTARLATGFEALLRRSPARLVDCLAPRPTPHALYFKKTAYNWLVFCRQLPPCQDSAGRPIPHTQFDCWHFPTAPLRDLAFLFLNGRWAFAWWCIVGDDFHVARWMLDGFPINLRDLSPALTRRLLPLTRMLEQAMRLAIVFKRNAGKQVGSFDLTRCRAVTDRSDRLFGQHLGLTDIWGDVELLCRQVVKTDPGRRKLAAK